MSNRCRACNCLYSSKERLVRHLARKGQDESHVAFHRMAQGIVEGGSHLPWTFTSGGRVKILAEAETQWGVSMGWPKGTWRR